jgi:hypothetical protein
VVTCVLACAGCQQILGIEDPGGSTRPGSGGDAGAHGLLDGQPKHDGNPDSNTSACATVPTWGAAENIAAGSAFDLAAGDLDGNGTTDIAMANVTTVQIALGAGDATIGAFTAITSTPTPATGVLVADVDDDGLQDVVSWSGNTVGGGQASSVVTVYVQNTAAHGTFTAHTFNAGGTVEGILAGKLNADERADLVIATQTALTVWFASGSPGQYTQGPTIGSGAISDAVGVVDVDGDGLADIAFADPAAGVHIYLNTTATPGTFPGTPITVGSTNNGAVLGHFSASTTRLDLLIFATGAGNTLTLYTQGDNGVFSESSSQTSTFQLSHGNRGLLSQVIDLNKDGRDDIATYGAAALQCGMGTFYPGEQGGDLPVQLGTNGGGGMGAQLLVDLNVDGEPELLQLAGVGGNPASILTFSKHL